MSELIDDTTFPRRHIGLSRDASDIMLESLGMVSLEQLTHTAVPIAIRDAHAKGERPAAGEPQVLAELRALADMNTVAVSMIGQGYHPTITPAVIRRNVLENPAWYTAYTPYQPEISQGRLEAQLNFQTLVSELTGLGVASASLLDEATAAAEAVALMHRASRSGSDLLLIDADSLPQTLAVVRTRCEPLGIEVRTWDVSQSQDIAGAFGVLLAYPGSSGRVRDLAALVQAAHQAGALVAVATDPLALTLLTPPGEVGADIAIGSAQRLGVPMFYGGPHAGYMAVRAGLERQIPGRLVGVSIDAAGRPAYRLTLQTREQHIRREKATSNVCTAQALLAVVASMYAIYHGPEGLIAIAEEVNAKASALGAALRRAGVPLIADRFFDTVTVSVPGSAAEMLAKIAAAGIRVFQRDADELSISCSEKTTLDDLRTVAGVFGADVDDHDLDLRGGSIPLSLQRRGPFLTHPVFQEHRTETQLMRYARELADYDLALDRTMIPLGSCTMKLNSAVELEPISWSGFADIHPFALAEDVAGYLRLIDQLEGWLADITGYARVSLQPNAGSQGELAGLLAIRGYHRSRGEHERDICLIPASAHGTNAASAVMAGMKVVVVATLPDGSVDLDDVRRKCDEHHDRLAAIMVTYPSTHGVYEEGITALCRLVHDAGGQVYVDGANLNALVGHARPGKFGGDVSHLNLHKTFAIPHGGGGPGVGPVAVAEHLAPFLPSHPIHPQESARAGAVGPVSAAPFGSAGILPISWAYIRLMGSEGLADATTAAILAANYVAHRLDPHYPVLYRGTSGLVAHE